MTEQEFSCKDVPEEQLTKVANEIANYSSILIQRDEPRGSGTFVRINNRFGVLTAAHVVDSIDLSAGSSSRLGLMLLQGQAHNFFIEGQFMRPCAIKGDSYGPDGPDVAFLEFMDLEKVGWIKAYRSFWDISRAAYESLVDEVNMCKCMWAMAGLPGAIVVREPAQDGFSEVRAMRFETLFGAVSDGPVNRDNHDYYEMEADYTVAEGLPVSFGGLSGGGLWCIPVSEASKECLEFKSPKLVGSVYYESALENQKRRLYCHGAKSIYCRLPETLLI